MKKIYMLLSVLCFAAVARAQFSAGQKMIGGQVSMGYTKVDRSALVIQKQDYFTVGLSPVFSRFVKPDRINGFGVSYRYTHQKTDIGSPSEATYNAHFIGVFVSQTKLQTLAKKFYFTLTGTAGANYQFQKNTTTVGGNTNDSKGYGLYLRGGIGLLYQLNQRFILTTQLNNLVSLDYSHDKITSTNGTNTTSGTSNGIGFTTGLNGFNLNSVSVGVNYLLK